VDDSATPLWNSTSHGTLDPIAGDAWLVERSSRDQWTSQDTDWIFFGHGNRYKDALGDFVAIAGRIPLMPLAAYGVWWSRYWPYSEDAITEVLNNYRDNQLPLHVLVLDMDWHIVTPDPDGEPPDSPLLNCNHGWGGYVWNRSLFGNPVEFQRKIHERGLKFVINTHDQCGVQSTQGDLYNEVDYWWTDFCDLGTPGQGAGNTSNYRCIADGSRGALWSNILHAEGAGRGGERRGLVLTIDGGLGNHRYPQVGSGDTYANWTTLDFQVEFAATAANVGVAWTFDLGGFMVDDGAKTGGTDTPINRRMRDPEMFLRWLQFGAVSPSFRTHCAFCEIRPWLYPNFAQLAPVYQFRSEFVPYIYTAAATAYRTGVLAIHPMYYEYPEHDEAYLFKGQYLFGPSFLAAPVTTPSQNWTFGHWNESAISQKDIWLPPGTWVEWFSAKIFEVGPNGLRLTGRQYSLTDIPLFARAGAVVPLRNHDANKTWPDPLILSLVGAKAGNRRTSEVYEDAGDGQDYTKGAYRITRLTFSVAADGNSSELEVTPRALGSGYADEPDVRSYEVVFRCAMASSCELPASVTFNDEKLPQYSKPPTDNSNNHGYWFRPEDDSQDWIQRAVVRLDAVDQTRRWKLGITYWAVTEAYSV